MGSEGSPLLPIDGLKQAYVEQTSDHACPQHTALV